MAMSDTIEKGSGNFLSFILSGMFFLIVGWVFHQTAEGALIGKDLNDVTVFEFVILTLAVFRLQRLFVYDTVAQWVRDLFLETKEVLNDKEGVIYVVRSKYKKGIRRLFADLLSCPWCVGVWCAVGAVITYFMYPITWPFWLLMAIAGASSFVQILANYVGWSAEGSKIIVKKRGGQRQ